VDTDHVVAGWANFWTLGTSTMYRNYRYGDKVAGQHEGFLFDLGQGLGLVASLGLGFLTPNALVGSIGWAQRVAQSYTVAMTGIGTYNTTSKIHNGELDWSNPWSYLELAGSYGPLAGFAAQKIWKAINPTHGTTVSSYPILDDPWLTTPDVPYQGSQSGGFALHPLPSRMLPSSTITDPSRMLAAGSPSRGLDLSIALPGAELAGGFDRLPSIVYQGQRKTLFHYTNEAGYEGILSSQKLRQSKGFDNARSGDGQYLTNLNPERIATFAKQELTQQQIQKKLISLQQASTYLFGRGTKTSNMSHFIEIDITDLPIRQSLTTKGDKIKDNVQFILNDRDLDLTGRIVSSGRTL
jgi:HYD1 signature containing ADP-ribosyltransferase